MKAKDLKNSILQMAVEGKLVSQDPTDEPASVLLERIREEKHKLIAEGKAKFPKGGESIIYTASDGSPYEKRVDAKGRVLSEECIAGEVPFELPEGWCWTRLSSLFSKMGSGSTPAGGRNVYKSSGPMLIRSQNVHDDGLRIDNIVRFDRAQYETRGSHVFPKDMLLNITGASIGRCAIVPDEFDDADVNQHVLIMRPIDPEISPYVHLSVTSSMTQTQIMSQQVGATKEGLSATKAMNLLLPIPPLAEQRRIVEKVDELMPLVEEYGRLEDAREALDAGLSDRLRKSILQQAIQGRLAPQDPSDEPASALLERVRAERRRLVKEGKARFPKGGESVIYTGSDGGHYEKRLDAKGRVIGDAPIEDEIPFDIPEGWAWARLGSVSQIRGGATPDKSNSAYWNGTVNWASMKDIHGDFLLSTIDRITEEGLASKTSIGVCQPGELIVSTRLVPGKSIISKIVTAINQDLKIVQSDAFLVDFLHYWFQSQLDVFKRLGSGTTVPGIKLEHLESSLIPTPPLAEQARIVDVLHGVLPPLTNQ